MKETKKLRKKKLNKKPSLGQVIRVNKTLNEAKETNTQKTKTRYNWFSFVDFRYYKLLASDILFQVLNWMKIFQQL